MRIRTQGLLTVVALAAAASMALPGASASEPRLRVDATGYQPAAYDPAIPEHPRKDDKNWDFGNPDLGGILTVVVANDGEADATVTAVTVDGVPLDTFLAGTCQDAGLACQATPPREMAWARWLPGPVIPGGAAAAFQLKRTTAPETTTITIDVGGEHLTVPVALAPSPIRLGLAYRDGSDAVIVVRNDGATVATIQDVRLGGAAAAFTALGGQTSIGPGRTAILRLAGAAQDEGAYASLTVRSSRGDATASVRLFTPFFPIGNWLSGSSWNDPDFMADVVAHHIDTSWGYASTIDKARQHQIKLIADAVPCAPGQVSDCIAAADEEWVAAYAYGDEVEFGHAAQEVLANVELRRTRSTRPTYINDAAQRIFQVFAAQADIGSMDHYTSGIGLCTITTAQPSSMQGQPVEWAGNYTRQLKLNVEPNPAWTWSQAGNWKNSSRSCWHGVPTVGEMQAQVYSELANGAKGITWFIFNAPDLVASVPELWGEAGRLGATLDATRGWFSTGDLDPGALVAASSNLEIGVISGPHAVVASVLDLSYRSKPKGYEWTPRSNVQVSIALPAWMAGLPVTVARVQGGVSSTLSADRHGNVIEVTIPTISVGTILVVRPSE
jgi:hypothetical protein